ncbi:related to spherulin 1A precursor [Phialocephala subalpina]|uniref:Related to spherulin 1A n=1 Tax=Phialocephala subalpina TaxID=576137 RepID=A0A1L7WJL6_9HELO|nr:related to spherulin 1A precursor [Phialocephala subalpina]
MLTLKIVALMALGTISVAAPTQEPIIIQDSPEFPIPQPLPFNATIPGVDYDLIAKLHAAPDQISRIALLEDKDFAFDFISPPNQNGVQTGEGGTLSIAISRVMPALVGNGMAAGIGFTKPCGFNTPHTHPRATEIAILVKGNMISEFVQETGARKIRNEHKTFSMVLFPQGALHLEFNPDCDEMIFIAAFNSEDPGVNTPAESLFMLDDDFSALATGLEFLPGADIDKFRHLVPATIAQGVESCLKRCGIKKNEL